MSKVAWKGSVMTAPVPPVLVSCRSGDSDNIITVAWTGTVCTQPPMTYISLRPQRHSYNIIKESGEFVVNLAPSSLVNKVDYCGIYTGAKVDKFEKCGFTKLAASKVSAPIIAECPVSLECKVDRIIKLGTHDMFLAEIVALDIDEELIDKSGKLRLDRADLLAFSHGEYFSVGKKAGDFGCSVKKRRKNTRARPNAGNTKSIKSQKR